jgi:hypothetical protein
MQDRPTFEKDLTIMRGRWQPKVTDHSTPDEPTPAGVDLAAQYGYSDAAKAHGKANGGDIRRAYRARFEPLFQRGLQQ